MVKISKVRTSGICDETVVTCEITAPISFWEGFKFRGGGVVESSECLESLMLRGPFVLMDFSVENLSDNDRDDFMNVDYDSMYTNTPYDVLFFIIDAMNKWRLSYLETGDEKYLQQIRLLMPSCYNRKKTVIISKRAALDIISAQKDARLPQWEELVEILEKIFA